MTNRHTITRKRGTIANHPDEVKILYANEIIRTIKSWFEDHRLEIVEHKTELVLFVRQRKHKTVEICIGTHVVSSQPSLKYLGVTFDSKLSFKSHLKLTEQKATTINSTLARMLSNIGGLKHGRRLLLSRVVTPVLLYAAPVCASAVKIGENHRQLQAEYWLSALRTCCAYRTTSYEVACVITETIPMDILANEASRLYQEASLNVNCCMVNCMGLGGKSLVGTQAYSRHKYVNYAEPW